ncbi:MAG: hypothetical protein JRI68_19875 [Deltaproteobacteria bacterium]|nr:hypothetical protein [Deltaproteobacteria bacterium]
MALPQRTPSWVQNESRHDDRGGSAEPLISIGYPELFGVDEVDEDEPWCVDHGNGMDVMSTARVRAALAAGELSFETKVWRDGNGFWHEIGELPELVGEVAYERQPSEPSVYPSDSLEEEPVEQSTIRRVRRSSWDPLAADEPGDSSRAAAIATVPSLKVALVALALLLLPSAGYLAARVVGGHETGTPPLRAKADDLGDRLVRHELTVRIQPFPNGSLGPRPAVTYVVPPPTRPGLLGMR